MKPQNETDPIPVSYACFNHLANQVRWQYGREEIPGQPIVDYQVLDEDDGYPD